jgi:hypothetical protein
MKDRRGKDMGDTGKKDGSVAEIVGEACDLMPFIVDN